MVNTWKPILAALVIFAAGVVTGGLTIRFTLPHPPQRPAGPGGFPDFGRRPDFLDRMQRELSLTDDQRKQIGDILHQSQDNTRKLWETIAPQARAEHERTRERIREVLAEEQRKKFDESFKMYGPGKPPDWRKGELGRGPRGNREANSSGRDKSPKE